MAQKKKRKKKDKAPAAVGTAFVALSSPGTSACDDQYAAAERQAARVLAGLDEKERADIIAAPDVEVPRDSSVTENDIAQSIISLRGEDITPMGDADRKKRKRPKKKLSLAQNLIMLTVFVLCAAVAVYCIADLIGSIRDKLAGEEIYSGTDFDHGIFDDENSSFNHPMPLKMLNGDASMMTLYDRILSKNITTAPENSEYSKKLDAMRASLTALKAKNKDIYGWIYIENTVIDHPIVQGSDNSFYLDHAYTGEALPIGSIFIDSTAEEHLTDNYNSVLYGHNVVDVAGSKSSMFHDITKFFDEAFFAENKIYIYTMDGIFIFKPVSVYTVEYNSEFYQFLFNSEEEFVRYANSILPLSKLPSGGSFAAGDRMLTIYTCTNGVNNLRYVLHSKLIETIQ